MQIDASLIFKKPVPAIMAILNVTPDSFSDGGLCVTAETAADRARQLAEDGADIIDIGGESTRPGSAPVDEAEELRRVVPAVRAIREAGIKLPLSIDTRRASVAAACIELGAAIINDVSALESDPDLPRVVRDAGVFCVLMHGYNQPEVPVTTASVISYLRKRIDFAVSCGINREKLIADPGFGFNKNTDENLEILAHLGDLAVLEVPILSALSRKRFIGAVTGEPDAARRVSGSVAGALWSAAHGAAIVRVHDVRETKQALDVWQAANALV
jgi:dihydropteroate synthase